MQLVHDLLLVVNQIENRRQRIGWIWPGCRQGGLARVSRAVGVSAMLLSLLIGASIGVLAGFFKPMDGPLMRFTSAMDDWAEARALGKTPGGNIFIHGASDRGKRTPDDWTWGCIALPNDEMEEVYAMVRTGTPVLIYR